MDPERDRKKEPWAAFVNDRPVRIYRGMKVKHALLALDQTLFKAAQDGEILVRDDQGFLVGLEGALHHQARLYAEKVKEEKRFKGSRGQGNEWERRERTLNDKKEDHHETQRKKHPEREG